MINRVLVLSLASFSIFAQPGKTNLSQPNEHSHAEKIYHQAIELWRMLAESGNIRAQIRLAQIYRSGIGTTTDAVSAAKWFRHAAEQGDAYAQYELGFMYEMGTGVRPDYWEAEFWYQKAVAQGFCPGELNLHDETFP